MAQRYLQRFWVDKRIDDTQLKVKFIVALNNDEKLVPPDANPVTDHIWDNMEGQITLNYQVEYIDGVVYDGNPPVHYPVTATVNFINLPQAHWNDNLPHGTGIIIKHPNVLNSDTDLMDTSQGGTY